VSAPAHRPAPEPPQPSTVVAEPATVQACQADYQQRDTSGITTGHVTAQPHTLGHK
jgi:hypothetical protein